MVQCGVPAVIKSIPAGILQLSDPSPGIPATFIPTPAGKARIPRDSRRPHPRAHPYCTAHITRSG